MILSEGDMRETIYLNNVMNSIMCVKNEIEQEIGGDILFGAIVGSHSLGLQNSSSDIDVYFIVNELKDSNKYRLKKYIEVDGEQKQIDIICVKYKELLNEINDYIIMEKKYPTVLYRSQKEDEENRVKTDDQRTDFKRSIFYRIILSDFIINKEVLQVKLAELESGMQILDIIDYHYIRMYKNYKEVIEDKELVPIRKYLYVLHQISTCRYLINMLSKPTINFRKLVMDGIDNDILRDKIEDMYQKNRKEKKGKKDVYVAKDILINEYIRVNLEEIREEMKTDWCKGKALVI